MKRDYVKLWNALSTAEQQVHEATQSQLYRRATALIKQQETTHEAEPISTEETSEETQAETQTVSASETDTDSEA
jgi:hypothetical protein